MGDVYSLGATMYELIAGYSFKDVAQENSPKWMEFVVNEDPCAYLPDRDEDFRPVTDIICDKMMVADPADRWPASKLLELLADVETYVPNLDPIPASKEEE